MKPLSPINRCRDVPSTLDAGARERVFQMRRIFMSVAAISATPTIPTAAPSIAGKTADGDYKTVSPQSTRAADSDGDYKPLASSAAAQSSSQVQSSLTSLKVGG
jgi:hypothetical protein